MRREPAAVATDLMDWLASRVLDWSLKHGRRNLPWQGTGDPYRVWVAEIMLQQTQVETVIPYFRRFMAEFPTLQSLANASLDRVLRSWSGLGYYRRAHSLHRTANVVMDQFGGKLPSDLNDLIDLPGVGRTTAGGIRSGGFGLRGVILDGNVKRVLARVHAVEGALDSAENTKLLWRHAEDHTPQRHSARYAQAIMDFGSRWCTRSRPRCLECPLADRCKANLANRVSELPIQKRKRASRQETIRLLIAVAGSQSLLLQKRNQTGIWPGLWVPPVIESNRPATELIDDLNLANATIVHQHQWSDFTHILSHRRLTVSCHVVELATIPAWASTTSRELKWWSGGSEPPGGISRVTQEIMNRIREPKSHFL